jgi:hypothetical protein
LNEACGGVLLEVCRIVLALHVVAYCAHSSRTVLSSPYYCFMDRLGTVFDTALAVKRKSLDYSTPTSRAYATWNHR